ncbi:TlpA family protein disulfide reductase [Rhodovarius crocodyli]|uniref:TlpA family protein disulfide reductase n=1 Tax=Rhodovarius crocodyli TaxID=1979269 RepID=A0A437MLS7_9PROT|nr:TlpA disulfide reductase family protein [Rhodovarius crocodyli]RVT98591.1 TlpA family protein disulfide reductase [Rhodovarius crocodyli]
MVLGAVLATPFAPRPAGAAGSGGNGAHRIREGRRPLPDFTFLEADGTSRSAKDFQGKALLINLWATWCPPCVAEMPALDRAAGILAPEGFSVLPLSSDRGGANQVRGFYERTQVKNLPVVLDPRGAAARAFGARGLPTTIIVSKAGEEVARAEGEAEWDDAQILAILRRLA